MFKKEKFNSEIQNISRNLFSTAYATNDEREITRSTCINGCLSID